MMDEEDMPLSIDEDLGQGRKRERDGEADHEGAAAGASPATTPGLAPQKKPRLTFGGGLRAISATQALEKKKLEPSSPRADASATASPHPGSAEGGVAPVPPLELVSPLGGPLGEQEQGPPLSLGAAALEGDKKPDKPRLVFPAAAKVAPGGAAGGGEERPKPKLTFGGGLSGAAAGASSPATASPSPLDAAERRSSSGLRWPAAANSTASTPTGAMPPGGAAPPPHGLLPSQAPHFPPGVAPGYYGGAPHAQGTWGEGMMEAHRMHGMHGMNPLQQQLASSLAAGAAARSPGGATALNSAHSLQRAPQRGGGAASGGAAHLEALSDSDGEGSGQGKGDKAPRSVSSARPAGGGDGMLASGDKGLAAGGGTLLSGTLLSGGPPHAPSAASLSVGADARKLAGAGGAGGEEGKVEGGSSDKDGSGDKDEPAQEPMSSEQLLHMIQVLDEAIAATDGEIASLQADALQGQGAIFRMPSNAPRKAPSGPILDGAGQRLLDFNNKIVALNKEAMAELTLTGDARAYQDQHIYLRVQDSPYFQLNQERHKVVEAHVQAHVRKLHRHSRISQLKQAVEYRQKMKAWMEANKEKKQRKKTAAVIPDLALDSALPRRRTRSTEVAEGGEGGEDDGDDCSASLAVVPCMVSSIHGTRATFRSHNALVLDPVEEEVKRHYLNVWSEEEKLIFVEKLVDFSLLPESKGMKKNFHRISQHLPNKTTRDCVQFYYLNKKTKLFKVLYKKFEQKNRKSYSLKNKYRARDDSKDRTTSAETNAADECPNATFSCLDPSILLNRPDENDDDQPEVSYQRRKYVNYGYGR